LSREGTIIAAHGRHYEVEDADRGHWQAMPRGKKSIYACGDRVHIEPTGQDQARIVDHLTRESLLYRSDAFRQKLIAANVGQIVIVAAVPRSGGGGARGHAGDDRPQQVRSR